MTKITVIEDLSGKFVDRFTVIIDNTSFTMSDRPTSPQGVNQWTGNDEIVLDKIPSCLKTAIRERCITMRKRENHE
jgi:hypothetical protein